MRRPVLTLAILASGLLVSACSTPLRAPREPSLATAPQAVPPVSAVPAATPSASVPRTVRPAKRPSVLERTDDVGHRVRKPGALKTPRRAWFELVPEHPGDADASR